MIACALEGDLFNAARGQREHESSRGTAVRNTVQPPPTSHCDRCGGQLALKGTNVAHSILGTKSNVFVCVTCGTEHSYIEHHYVGESQFTAADGRSVGSGLTITSSRHP